MCPICQKPDLQNESEQNTAYLNSLTHCLKILFNEDLHILEKFMEKLEDRVIINHPHFKRCPKV